MALFVDLHTFCDASDRAYSAVSYLRAEYSDGEVDLSLVAAKCKVAPLKQLSIPRLELQAALLGARMADQIKPALDFKIRETIFWTDSSTVISWIGNHERRYKMFIAHRLGQILELCKPTQWRWTPGMFNTADFGTKESRFDKNVWLNGPEFLNLKECQWPDLKSASGFYDNSSLELIASVTMTSKIVTLVSSVPDISRFSNWQRLIRSTGWVLKFVRYCKDRVNQPGNSLEPFDLRAAEKLWWKVEQSRHFSGELLILKERKSLPKSSKLFRLTPYFDDEGIIRISGRIGNLAIVNYDTKNPVILHSRSKYVSLMIDHFHRKVSHQGQELVINELRQQFWIIGIRRAVRSAWSRCSFCVERRAKPLVQRMGPLPPARLNFRSRPFSSTGVDYFGPLWVTNRRRKEKRYGVIFTCLTTRAVHLELAFDLSTDATILAIRRMISRRGCPVELWSDNATNFRGAQLELKKCLELLDHAKIKDSLIGLNIRWLFNPPLAPHMGGSWERLIRSIKTALWVTLKDRAPREDVLHTTLLETEHLLNTRPLTRASDDPADAEALTPNHFLIGSSSGSNLWYDTDKGENIKLRKRWQEAQRLADLFWKRWLREYVPTLVKSSRWFTDSPSTYIGQLVYVPKKESGEWTRGLITAVYPGKDGRIRVVDVKTEAGVLRRAVTSLIPLAMEQHLSGEVGGYSR